MHIHVEATESTLCVSFRNNSLYFETDSLTGTWAFTGLSKAGSTGGRGGTSVSAFPVMWLKAYTTKLRL